MPLLVTTAHGAAAHASAWSAEVGTIILPLVGFVPRPQRLVYSNSRSPAPS